MRKQGRLLTDHNRPIAHSCNDQVHHDKFGYGTVVSTLGSDADGEAMIDFGTDVGVRRLVLRFAPLKKL